MRRALYNLLFTVGCLTLLLRLQSSADAGLIQSDAFPALSPLELTAVDFSTVDCAASPCANENAEPGEEEFEPLSILWWQIPDGLAQADSGAGVGSRAVDGPSTSSPQVAIAALIPELAAEASALHQPEETRLHDRFSPSRLFRPPRCAVHHL